jgi:carboxypeptidase C (cathepsin A)
MNFISRNIWTLGLALLAVLVVATTAIYATADDSAPKADKPEVANGKFFKVEESHSAGSVRAGGTSVSYDAVAGTLIVHAKDWDDVPPPEDAKKDKDADDSNPNAEASMFYVAYFQKGANPQSRPITFVFNGGPGSATVWLHMGAFGPKRVVTVDGAHTPAAPYKLVDNDSSLLDVSDLVFIDAPGAGFSRIAGKDKEKAFFGVDEDAEAFANFIAQFLSKYGRWNSPKYLFGESYGTTRSAVLVNLLETQRAVDFNGVILLSQILNFDLSPDGPYTNPGIDLPYQLALPTYAASAWYHKKGGKAFKDLPSLLRSVQAYAMGPYAQALQAGGVLTQKQKQEVAKKLNQYTGLPVSYILKADLRIDGGEFEKNLQDDQGYTTGRLDTRFFGPTMDPLSKEADYDPQSAAISSAYVSAFNDYVRRDLKFSQNRAFRLFADTSKWNFQHQPPGVNFQISQSANVMPDLATAMKYNPNLKVMLNAGYYDLATPFYEGVYEMRHLPIPRALQNNIRYQFYESGHMVYANSDSLKALHDHVADFIRDTDNQG